MEINLDLERRQWLWGLLACFLFGLAVLGRFVSPLADDRPQLLTADRWQALALQRQAAAEIQRLTADAQTLRVLAEREHPDAIQALSLAQRLYATQRTGTAATAPARQALIGAAEATARYAAGGLDRAEMLQAVNAALARIQALTPPATESTHAVPAVISQSQPDARVTNSRRTASSFLPLVYGGSAHTVREGR